MTKIYRSLVSLNGSLMCSIDLETTGRLGGYHEIIQIGCVAIDSEFEHVRELKPFYTYVKPDYPERREKMAQSVHGLDLDEIMEIAPSQIQAAEMFVEWFQDLDLPLYRKIVVLAHNWSFEKSFMSHWLGIDIMDQIIHPHARDSQRLAAGINDMYEFRTENPPFRSLALGALCKQLEIVNDNPHDALADAIATAKLYHALITQYPVFPG